jgi:hypothetical protein
MLLTPQQNVCVRAHVHNMRTSESDRRRLQVHSWQTASTTFHVTRCTQLHEIRKQDFVGSSKILSIIFHFQVTNCIQLTEVVDIMVHTQSNEYSCISQHYLQEFLMNITSNVVTLLMQVCKNSSLKCNTVLTVVARCSGAVINHKQTDQCEKVCLVTFQKWIIESFWLILILVLAVD